MTEKMHVFSSRAEFEATVGDHLIGYMRDVHPGAPDVILSNIPAVAKEWCQQYSYLMFAVTGITSSELANLIARAFGEMDFFASGGQYERVIA